LTTVNKMKKKSKKAAPKRTKSFDKLVAYHEAGHAVMAYHKGGKFPSMHMDLSHLLPNVVAAVAPVKWPSGKGTERNEGLYRLAGRVVVEILLKNPDEYKENRNIDDLNKFCKLWKTKQEREKYFLELYLESITFFKEPVIWKQVEIVAEYFLERRLLTYDDVELCIKSVESKKRKKQLEFEKKAWGKIHHHRKSD